MQKRLKFLLNVILVLAILMAFFLFARQQFFPKSVQFSVIMPGVGIDQTSLGVVAKRGDAASEQAAQLYLKLRNLSPEHLFYIDLPNSENVTAQEFGKAYQALQSELPDAIQGLVVTWNKPYRVDCMSMTSAMTFGFDQKWCQLKPGQCSTTEHSPYFNSDSRTPWRDFGIRPTMMLAGNDMGDIERLIKRGMVADFSNPIGAKAYLLKTKDDKRSVRWPQFQFAQKYPPTDKLRILAEDLSHSRKDYLENQTVFIYQTGGAQIKDIDDNTYLPGAVADHLTSFGGQGFSTDGQMKAIRWLEAGATGSYGTVVEPCNYVTKFPDANVLLKHYALGETLMESYWKSVRMPGEGLFIGEPLARPFGVFELQAQGNRIQLRTNRLSLQEKYQLEYFDHQAKVFRQVKEGSVAVDRKRREILIQFRAQKTNQYRIVKRTAERP